MLEIGIGDGLHETLGFFEHLKESVVAFDAKGKIIFANEQARRTLGIETLDKGVVVDDVLADLQIEKAIASNVPCDVESLKVEGVSQGITCLPIAEEGEVVGGLLLWDDLSGDKESTKGTEVNILSTILEIAYDGIVVVNSEGYITMISNAYKKFLGLEDRDVLGKHVTDVIENTRMHIVAKTRIPEINDLQKINGTYMIATRMPYYTKGRFAGVIGKVIFRNITELNNLHERIGKMEQEIKRYRSEFETFYHAKYTFDSIVGQSKKILEIKQIMKRVAVSRSNVLLQGESGTGKELFAHALHNESRRRLRPFVSVNCAAIPEALLEAELFGYEKGAFTGANRNGQIGKFEIADGGTIFLDEIGDMPLGMQAKILRVLQDGEVERIGSNKPKQIDIRIIAATNRPLKEMVKDKTFREDLYYRLNVMNLYIPPLRERKADIQVIAYHLLDQFNRETGRHIVAFSEKAKHLMMRHDWPGNVRELFNVIERAYAIMEEDTAIQVYHLPAALKGETRGRTGQALKDLVETFEKKVITDRLVAFGGNKSLVAKDLDISRMTLYNKLDRYDLDDM